MGLRQRASYIRVCPACVPRTPTRMRGAILKAKPMAGYYRVSVAHDGMKAPELYESEIERYCKLRDLKLGHTFADIDHSAFRGARTRPALEELKARRGEFSAVVIPKLSRFGRRSRTSSPSLRSSRPTASRSSS